MKKLLEKTDKKEPKFLGAWEKAYLDKAKRLRLILLNGQWVDVKRELNQSLLDEMRNMEEVLSAVYSVKDAYAQENEALKLQKDSLKMEIKELTRERDILLKENHLLRGEVESLKKLRNTELLLRRNIYAESSTTESGE